MFCIPKSLTSAVLLLFFLHLSLPYSKGLTRSTSCGRGHRIIIVTPHVGILFFLKIVVFSFYLQNKTVRWRKVNCIFFPIYYLPRLKKNVCFILNRILHVCKMRLFILWHEALLSFVSLLFASILHFLAQLSVKDNNLTSGPKGFKII